MRRRKRKRVDKKELKYYGNKDSNSVNMVYSIEDQVHGKISLPEYTRAIIDSETFQRLRNLKQLGVSNYYFKNAVHCRFEHSIGTAHLAELIIGILETNSRVKIDEKKAKCVILGALLHDIGHGPFSHLWEDCVRQGTDKEWTHEDQSDLMIKYMISSNGIKLDEDKATHDYMLTLICSLITGDSDEWSRLLKPSEMFLTEIVSNKFCNIDVDKCDYLLRDHHYVGVEIKPFMDFLNRAKIVSDERGLSHIGYHVDDFYLIENMFINRAHYHNVVYQLAEVAGAERQLKDICLMAEKAGFKVMGRPMTEIQHDCQAYNKLDDSILDLIRKNTKVDNEAMRKSKQLLNCLDTDRLYTMVWEATDQQELDYIYEKLERKFGDIFCKVKKEIPKANVPENIPMYNANGDLVPMISEHVLKYKSTFIFCTAFDSVTIQNVSNYLLNNHNNNNNNDSA